MPLPNMMLVRQKFPDHRLPDVRAAVWDEMMRFQPADSLSKGARIAIGVGSRGINNLPVIVKTVVDFWKAKGCKPFIFPAMGSHGDAFAEGQRLELAKYDILEETIGCPIISNMDVVATGLTPEGIPTFVDKHAMHSDGIMVINRVKWHTDFSGPIESGIMKMIAIGLGKDKGAGVCHRRAYQGENLYSVIRSVARQVMGTRKVLGGLAVLEDAYNNTATVAALPVDELERREEKLLKKVKEWKPNLPCALDVLIVSEMGKNISGPGMDTKVINRRTVDGANNPYKDIPWIGRVCTLSLHPLSKGNAMGVGLADCVNNRILDAADWGRTYLNAYTAQAPSAVKIPPHFATDRECLEIAINKMTCDTAIEELKVGWIKNTLNLSTFALSENLVSVVESDANLQIIAPARPFAFDAQGQMSWKPFLL